MNAIQSLLLDLLQKPGAIDQDIGGILADDSIRVKFDLPLSRLIIPNRLQDFGLKRDVFVQVVLGHGCLDVGVNLGLGRVELRPVRVRLKQKGIGI